MKKLKQSLETFCTLREDVVQTYKTHVFPIINHGNNSTDLVSRLVVDFSKEQRSLFDPEQAPMLDDMTLGMIYMHYWGNSFFHYYDAAEPQTAIHIIDIAYGQPETQFNPYKNYSALYHALELMKNDVCEANKAQFNILDAHQNNIVTLVHADKDIYKEASRYFKFPEQQIDSFNMFWKQSEFNQKI
jgi:hypothetical protein